MLAFTGAFPDLSIANPGHELAAEVLYSEIYSSFRNSDSYHSLASYCSAVSKSGNSVSYKDVDVEAELPVRLANAYSAIELALDSIVKIFTMSSSPNYSLPWQNKSQRETMGSGSRILTNAHVVADYTFVLVRKHGSPTKYRAEVQAVGHEYDLAILVVDNEEFWEGMNPLVLGELPILQGLLPLLVILKVNVGGWVETQKDMRNIHGTRFICGSSYVFCTSKRFFRTTIVPAAATTAASKVGNLLLVASIAKALSEPGGTHNLEKDAGWSVHLSEDLVIQVLITSLWKLPRSWISFTAAHLSPITGTLQALIFRSFELSPISLSTMMRFSTFLLP